MPSTSSLVCRTCFHLKLSPSPNYVIQREILDNKQQVSKRESYTLRQRRRLCNNPSYQSETSSPLRDIPPLRKESLDLKVTPAIRSQLTSPQRVRCNTDTEMPCKAEEILNVSHYSDGGGRVPTVFVPSQTSTPKRPIHIDSPQTPENKDLLSRYTPVKAPVISIDVVGSPSQTRTSTPVPGRSGRTSLFNTKSVFSRKVSSDSDGSKNKLNTSSADEKLMIRTPTSSHKRYVKKSRFSLCGTSRRAKELPYGVMSEDPLYVDTSCDELHGPSLNTSGLSTPSNPHRIQAQSSTDDEEKASFIKERLPNSKISTPRQKLPLETSVQGLVEYRNKSRCRGPSIESCRLVSTIEPKRVVRMVSSTSVKQNLAPSSPSCSPNTDTEKYNSSSPLEVDAIPPLHSVVADEVKLVTHAGSFQKEGAEETDGHNGCTLDEKAYLEAMEDLAQIKKLLNALVKTLHLQPGKFPMEKSLDAVSPETLRKLLQICQPNSTSEVGTQTQ